MRMIIAATAAAVLAAGIVSAITAQAEPSRQATAAVGTSTTDRKMLKELKAIHRSMDRLKSVGQHGPVAAPGER
jgi:hypothetical protein